MQGIGSRDDRHGFQRFIGLEVARLSGEHSGNVLIHRHSRRDEQFVVAGTDHDRKVSFERGYSRSVEFVRAA